MSDSAGPVTGRASGTARTMGQAMRIAATLLWTRRAAVLVAMLCVQGALVWTMPLLDALVHWALRQLGVDGVNIYTFDEVLTSPLALLVLVGIAAVATLFVLAELTLFAVMAHLALSGEPITFGTVLRGSASTARKALTWQALLLSIYLTVLLPISGVGLTSHMTRDVTLPKFISSEMLKTTPGQIAYVVVMGAVVYAMARLLLFPAILAGGDETIVQAMGRSIRMTRWRPLLGFAAVMVTVLLAAWLVLVVAAGLGLGPVALAGTHTAAGTVIGLLALVRFLVAGTAAAFLGFFFVAYLRLMRSEPARVPAALPRARRTWIASLALVVVAALLAMPSVVTASRTADRATQSATQVIGHRGFPSQAVENSLPGLDAAASAGADVVETDIQETGDDSLVVMHDVGLGRLTSSDQKVHELTGGQVTALQLHQNGQTATIPTLAEFVHRADARGIRLLVEVKPHDHEKPGFARRVVEALDRLDPDHTHMIQSLDRGFIDTVSRLDPDRRTAFVVGFQIGRLPATSADAVVIEDWSFDPRMLTAAHLRDREIYVWTVNEIGPLRSHLTGGVDAVITDEVGRAVDSRHRLGTDPVGYYLETATRLGAIS